MNSDQDAGAQRCETPAQAVSNDPAGHDEAGAFVNLARENLELWEYVDAMEAINIAMDRGDAIEPRMLGRLNAAQHVLKERCRREGRLVVTRQDSRRPTTPTT